AGGQPHGVAVDDRVHERLRQPPALLRSQLDERRGTHRSREVQVEVCLRQRAQVSNHFCILAGRATSAGEERGVRVPVPRREQHESFLILFSSSGSSRGGGVPSCPAPCPPRATRRVASPTRTPTSRCSPARAPPTSS